jgi:hypothetical protein
LALAFALALALTLAHWLEAWHLLHDLIWHWHLNTSFLHTWHFDIDNFWHIADFFSLPVDNSWAIFVDSLVSGAHFCNFSVAGDLNVEGHFDGNLYWDVNVLVFGDVDFFFSDNFIWNLLLSINWDRNWFIIVAWFFDNDWNLFVDTAIDASSSDFLSVAFRSTTRVASIDILIKLNLWIFNHLSLLDYYD